MPLLAAIPGEERTILGKAPELLRSVVPELKLTGAEQTLAGVAQSPCLAEPTLCLAWPRAHLHWEQQVISRAALLGDAAQGMAGFTSRTDLRGSLRARREEVTAAAWLRSSKTAEGRKENKQQTAKGRLIGQLPEGLVGVVFLVLTLANFCRIVNLELFPKWGDFRCAFLNK